MNQQRWLINLLANKPKRLTCVGDDDQMIYGFRGADGDFILKFEKHFPDAKIIRLEQNYRSTKKILEGANNLISHNLNRKGKTLFTEKKDGEPIKFKTFYDN